MQGFKSFPDKTELTFGPGMTAVVGPNGSGKSNIADAVRWVLGEQSTKSLRGSRMEDVIFSGTGARKAQGFAEVTLRLDNTDRRLGVDQDEVAVTRRYFRSGESEYRINGAGVRLRDVHELFMDTGMGRDGYSMVSQGRIEDMVAAKAAERREMFEEAAGISHYRYRREDALKRLAAAEENLVRLRDIVTELENRVGPLGEQAEKAKQFLALSETKKTLEIGLWLDLLENGADSVRRQSAKLETARGQYEDVCASLAETVSKAGALREQISEKNTGADELRGKADETEGQASQREQQIAVNENSLANMQENETRLTDEIARHGASDDRSVAEIDAQKARLAGLDEQLGTLREKLENLQGEQTALRDEDASLADRLSRTRVRIAALEQSIGREQLQSASALSTVQELENRGEVVARETEARQAKLDALGADQKRLEGLIAEKKEKIAELTNAVSAHTMKVSSRAQALEQARLAESTAALDVQQLKSKLRLLDEMEKNMEGYQGSVRSVMQQAAAGALTGIVGPLSTVIDVESDYAVAVETALGAAIQNIVTRDEQDAKKAIAYLKKNDLGRATFMPMTSVTGRLLDEDVSAEAGYIGIAADLVDCDDDYREIVDSLLGRTAVAEDIDSAIAIGRRFSHRFKIVTLDGQVMNAGGSMTGGSRITQSGFLVRANERRALRDAIAQREETLRNRRDALTKAKDDYAAQQAAAEGARSDLTRAGEDKLRLETSLSVTLSGIRAEKTSLDALRDETLSAGERVRLLRQTSDEALARIGAMQSQKDEAETLLASLTGDAARSQEAARKAGEALAQINLEIAGLSRDRENCVGQIGQLEQRRSGRRDAVQALEEEREALRERMTNAGARIVELKRERDALRRTKQDILDRIADLVRQREQAEAESAALLEKERGLTQEREALSGECVRLEEKKNALEREQQETENRLFEEYKLTRREAQKLEIDIGTKTDARRRLSAAKAAIKALGNVNVGAIDEYREVSERYTFLSGQVDDVEKSKAELTRIITDLTDSMSRQFRERFAEINRIFSETFVKLFGGGSASLVLEDEGDILNSGIEIKAQPPGKNVRSLSLLSGGEKGLTAIALLFAMLRVTPAPFCIFDEVEAALDDMNVVRYAKYIRSITDKSQFILITHRRGTMEEADTLYGVTMQEKGVSKLLELQTTQMAEKLGLT